MLMVAIMHSHSPRVHRGTAGVRDSALLVSAEILHVLAGSRVWEITFSPSSQIDFQDRKTCFKSKLVLGQSCWRRELISISENWLVIWLRSVLCHPHTNYLLHLPPFVRGAVIGWRWSFWLAAALTHMHWPSCVSGAVFWHWSIFSVHTHTHFISFSLVPSS